MAEGNFSSESQGHVHYEMGGRELGVDVSSLG